MLKTLLAATTALTLMSGASLAQSSSSSSSTKLPTHDVDVTSTTHRTENRKGVMIEKDIDITDTSTPGRPATTQTRTDATTTHQ